MITRGLVASLLVLAGCSSQESAGSSSSDLSYVHVGGYVPPVPDPLTPPMTYPLHPSRASLLGGHVTYRHRAQVMIHGDSYDALDGLNLYDGGDFAPSPVGWPLIFAPLIGTDVHTQDVARGSKSWDWLIADAPVSVDPKFDPALLANIVVVEGGVNDVVGDSHDAGPAQLDSVIDNGWAYIDARHAAHPWSVIAIGPRPTNWVTPAGYHYWADRFRSECPSHADRCVDLAAEPDLGAWDGGTVDTTWSPDNSHQGPNGDARIATAVLAAVESIVHAAGM